VHALLLKTPVFAMSDSEEEVEVQQEVRCPSSWRGASVADSAACVVLLCAASSRSRASQEEVKQTQFDTADAGASHTYPQTASAVRKGAYMVIKGRPCKARSPFW